MVSTPEQSDLHLFTIVSHIYSLLYLTFILFSYIQWKKQKQKQKKTSTT